MARDEQLKRLWDNVVLNLSNQFADGEKLDLDAIIYIIGLQEKGNLKTKYNKLKHEQTKKHTSSTSASSIILRHNAACSRRSDFTSD